MAQKCLLFPPSFPPPPSSSLQGEPAQQDHPDDGRQPVHLLLAHADASRLREQGHSVHHQAEPGRDRVLRAAERLLLPRRRGGRQLRQRGHAALRGAAAPLHQHGGGAAATAAAAAAAAAADPAHAAPGPAHLKRLAASRQQSQPARLFGPAEPR